MKWAYGAIILAIAAYLVFKTRSKKNAASIPAKAFNSTPLQNLGKDLGMSANAMGFVPQLAQELMGMKYTNESKTIIGDSPTGSIAKPGATAAPEKKIKRDQAWWPLNLYDIAPEWAKQKKGDEVSVPCDCGCGTITLSVV